MPRSVIEAVGTVRMHLIAQPAVNEALEDLIKISLRQEKALRYYANKENYVDGVPCHPDEQNLLTRHDEGAMARYALGEDVLLLGARRAA